MRPKYLKNHSLTTNIAILKHKIKIKTLCFFLRHDKLKLQGAKERYMCVRCNKRNKVQ